MKRSSPPTESPKTMNLRPGELLFYITIFLYFITLGANSAIALRESNYDPEHQDGIPVFSARSVAKLDDEWTGNLQDVLRQKPIQRRQTDNDLDDGLEEEDEDEYKSGSSPHESIESPSYGESQRFAKDGDEIENFFDKHLGPPNEATDSAGDESADRPTIVRQEQVPATDPDDYEAAASGPIASIIHSLLGHSQDDKSGKRPFLQISTGSEPELKVSDNKSKEEPKESSSTALKSSQSTQNLVAASPISLAFKSLAAASKVTNQDSLVQESNGSPFELSEMRMPESEGTREIYIGRRPTVLSYLQQQQQHHQQPEQPQRLQLQHLSGGYTTSGSANVWRHPNGRPYVYQQDQADDYSRYPVAASYAYQQEPAATSPETSDGDDGQTVTYGLSFGGSSVNAEAEEPSSDGVSEQEAVEPAGGGLVNQQLPGYTPYSARYHTSPTIAQNKYQNSINYRQQMVPVVVGNQMVRWNPEDLRTSRGKQYRKGGTMAETKSRLKAHSGMRARANPATRYHRDPSESSSILTATMQANSGMCCTNLMDQTCMDCLRNTKESARPSDESHQDDSRERQQLLASLDKEIKASPQYRANMAQYLGSPSVLKRKQTVSLQQLKKNYLGNDLDSYISYHSESDPYKTRTTTSRMVSDPLAFLKQPRHPMPMQLNMLGREPEISNQAVGPENIHQDERSRSQVAENQNAVIQRPNQDLAGGSLLTGPLTNRPHLVNGQGDLLRNVGDQTSNYENTGKNDLHGKHENTPRDQGHSRVRRDDSDEREIDNDQDDDGVWVDDDDDDDNRQQSSDVNETSQYPEEEEEDDGQQDDATNNVLTPQQLNPPGVIGGPHGYELSPNDLMIYHG